MNFHIKFLEVRRMCDTDTTAHRKNNATSQILREDQWEVTVVRMADALAFWKIGRGLKVRSVIYGYNRKLVAAVLKRHLSIGAPYRRECASVRLFSSGFLWKTVIGSFFSQKKMLPLRSVNPRQQLQETIDRICGSGVTAFSIP